jgi:hypothetical protein
VGVVIAVVIAVVIVAVVAAVLMRRPRADSPADAAASTAPSRALPPVAEFHVRGERALVSFDVPLPAGDVDDVLRDLLVGEAVEVVREKRHSLPIDEVTRVVALARRGDTFVEVGTVDLDTPGELPPPITPDLLPHLSRDPALDPFDAIADLPEQAPGLAGGAGRDTLEPFAAEMRLPSAVEAGLRTRGLDPAAATTGEVALGLMQLAGYLLTPAGENTYEATRAGRRALVRIVDHRPGDHPELAESEIRRFAVDFASSGTERGFLITEKYSPFEVYDRERREPRCRFITRERLQHFIDGLSLG